VQPGDSVGFFIFKGKISSTSSTRSKFARRVGSGVGHDVVLERRLRDGASVTHHDPLSNVAAKKVTVHVANPLRADA